MATLPCRVIQEAHESHYDWKRIQTSEQQAQRERKNIIQKALVFARRARQIMLQEINSLWGIVLNSLVQTLAKPQVSRSVVVTLKYVFGLHSGACSLW